MLKFFRNKNVAKTVFWGVVVIIIIAFALPNWDFNPSKRNDAPPSVGTINNRKVSFEDLSGGMTGVRCQVVLNYFNQPQISDMLLKSNSYLATLAWDRLIMLAEVGKLKVKVPDKEVIAFIRSHPIFNRGGIFDEKIYTHALKYSMGLSPRSFEEMVRESMAIQKLNDIITKDIKVTDQEVLDSYQKDNQIFKLSYIAADLKDYLDKENPDEDAAKAAAVKGAGDNLVKIKGLMESEKLSFEDAASKLGLKTLETIYFSRFNKLDAFGEGAARLLADTVSGLKAGDLSGPISTRNAVLIFKVLEIQSPDMAKFEKNSSGFAKRALDKKKNIFLEGWLKGLEKSAALKIDFKDYDKYVK